MTDPKVLDAARALFKHNMGTFSDGPVDDDMIDVAWLLDDEVQQFWVAQVEVVQAALR